MVAPVLTRLTVDMTISVISESRSSEWSDFRFLPRRRGERARARALLCGAVADLQDACYDAVLSWVGGSLPQP